MFVKEFDNYIKTHNNDQKIGQLIAYNKTRKTNERGELMDGVFNTQNLYTLFLIIMLVFVFVILGAIFENWGRIKYIFIRILKDRKRIIQKRNSIKRNAQLPYINLKRHHI